MAAAECEKRERERECSGCANTAESRVSKAGHGRVSTDCRLLLGTLRYHHVSSLDESGTAHCVNVNLLAWEWALSKAAATRPKTRIIYDKNRRHRDGYQIISSLFLTNTWVKTIYFKVNIIKTNCQKKRKKTLEF